MSIFQKFHFIFFRMPKLTQKEFSAIDTRVFNYGKIQILLSVLDETNIDEIYQQISEFDDSHLNFIAYSIIEICKIRINKDQIYGKLFHMLLTKSDTNKNKMIDFIFKESSPILRIVFDLGGIQKSEIEKRNSNKFPSFSEIFENIKIKSGLKEIDTTKDLIYNKYEKGTIERAIFDNENETTINQILQNTQKKLTDKISKSLFDFYDENDLPTIAQFAFHCNAQNAINVVLQNSVDYNDLLDYAIKSGENIGLNRLIEKGCSLDGKFKEAANFSINMQSKFVKKMMKER